MFPHLDQQPRAITCLSTAFNKTYNLVYLHYYYLQLAINMLEICNYTVLKPLTCNRYCICITVTLTTV